jgi:tetratricopeptide (TPR) repeat protein
MTLEYIGWKEMRAQQGNGAAKLLTIEGLQRRGWLDLYFEQTKETLREKKTSPISSVAELHEKLIVKDHYFYHATDMTWGERAPESHELMEHLNHYYTALGWKYQCERISRQRLQRVPPDPVPLFLQTITQSLGQMVFPARLYADIYKMVEGEDEALYAQLKDFYDRHRKASEEYQILLVALINFQSRRVSRGEETSYAKVFQLYQSGLQHRIFALSGFFPNAPFNNIVTVACKVGEYAWVQQFIEDYAALLHPDEKENTYALSKAKVFFEQGQYEQALDILEMVDSKKMAVNLPYRLLRIRLYYELPNYHLILRSECKNLLQYARRNTPISVTIQQMKPFVQVVKGLLDGLSRAELLRMVQGSPAVLMKDWLEEKIDAYTGG